MVEIFVGMFFVDVSGNIPKVQPCCRVDEVE